MRFIGVIVSELFLLAVCQGFQNEHYKGCPRYERKCANGKCIPGFRFCDGIKDCSDDSDEVDCDSHLCDPKRSFLCKSTQCIDKSKVCDGNYDCHDDDDEDNCDKECEHGFLCSSGVCLLNRWRCDGNEDCTDGDDEENCKVEDSHCPPNHFACADMSCIPIEHRCDSYHDCDNDEEHCGNVASCFERNGDFLCKDGQKCLRRAALCDKKTDCDDGSDEGGMCDKECSELQCSNNCFKTPEGPKCYCPNGFQLIGDTKCEDINECALDIAVCDHTCTNTEGDFKCSCDDGYYIENKTACVCNSTEPALMIFSVGNHIEVKVLVSKSSKEVIPDKDTRWKIFRGQKKISSIAYDPEEAMVYWVSGENSIYMKQMSMPDSARALWAGTGSGSSKHKLSSHRLYKPHSEEHISKSELFVQQVGSLQVEHMALDWFGRNLYVTDRSNKHILVCSLSSKSCKVLLKDVYPRSIQLDLENRYLYYSDTQEGTLEKVAMDGSSRTTIVKNHLDWPNGIALDPPAQRLYWLDAKLYAIKSANYNGEDSKKLPQAEVEHPFSVAVWESNLYWTEWSDRGKETHQSIHSCRKIDGRGQTIEYRNHYNSVNCLTIHHPSMFQNVFDPCRDNTCSEICLLSPTQESEYICACPLEMTLSSNGRTCEEKPSSDKLLTAVTESDLVKFMLISPREYGLNEKTEVRVHDSDLKSVAQIAFDPKNDKAYIIDGKGGKIYGLNILSMKLSEIYSTMDIIKVITVDFMTRNIYFTTSFHRHVSVLQLEKNIVKILEANATYTTGLAVDVYKKFLFISDEGTSVPNGCIHRCALNGEGCIKVIKNIRRPSSIAVEQGIPLPRLYWTSKHDGAIWSSLYDGTLTVPIKKDLFEPAFITVGSKYTFWMSADGRDYGTAFKYGLFGSKITPSSAVTDGKILAMQTLSIPENYPIDKCSDAICSDFCFPLDDENFICECRDNQEMNEDAKCEQIKCPKHKQQCDNGQCIARVDMCDHQVDCRDGSDEAHCESECNESNYVCHDGTCIQENEVCDGFNDCPDQSDESNERCQKCDPNDWKCQNGECIPSYWRCNNKDDCSDKSDEEGCDQNECLNDKDFMKCNDGFCIPSSWKCDNSADCTDGEDEDGCTCLPTQFTCASGKCIDSALKCNDEKDCPDGSDETDELCDIPSVWIERACSVDRFSCGSDHSICIGQDQICDGTADCPNKLDEEDCLYTCPRSWRKCTSEDRCIPESWYCDGNVDCDDGSDEVACTELERVFLETCPLDHFPCEDGPCITKDKLCDTTMDCLHGDDEVGQCNACSEDNAGCQHICHNHPGKAYCSCKPGFKLGKDRRKCEDIDECKDERVCHQECTNRKGGYDCSCYSGYAFGADKKNCKAVGKQQSYAAVVRNGHLEFMNEVFFEKATKLKLPKNVSEDHLQLDYESRNGTFIILDTASGKFYQQNGTSWKRLHLDVKNPYLLTIDDDRSNMYVVENMYWQNKTIHIIRLCSITTQSCAVSHRVMDGNLTAIIASSLPKRVFFCVNTDDGGTIHEMDLEGYSRQIHNEKVLSCDALDVSDQKRRVYFADNELGTIESISYSGYDRTRLFTKHVNGVNKISYLYHSLLWQTFPSRNMFSCAFDNSTDCKQILFEGRLLGNIHMDYHPDDDSCIAAKCSHICTVQHEEIACLCPTGFLWNEVDHACEKNPNSSRIVYGLLCSDNPCKNGTCVTVHNYQIMCDCKKSYSGMFCELRDQDHFNVASFFGYLFLVVLIIVMLAAVYYYRETIFPRNMPVFGRYRFWKQPGLVAEEEISEDTDAVLV